MSLSPFAACRAYLSLFQSGGAAKGRSSWVAWLKCKVAALSIEHVFFLPPPPSSPWCPPRRLAFLHHLPFILHQCPSWFRFFVLPLALIHRRNRIAHLPSHLDTQSCQHLSPVLVRPDSFAPRLLRLVVASQSGHHSPDPLPRVFNPTTTLVVCPSPTSEPISERLARHVSPTITSQAFTLYIHILQLISTCQTGACCDRELSLRLLPKFAFSFGLPDWLTLPAISLEHPKPPLSSSFSH